MEPANDGDRGGENRLRERAIEDAAYLHRSRRRRGGCGDLGVAVGHAVVGGGGGGVRVVVGGVSGGEGGDVCEAACGAGGHEEEDADGGHGGAEDEGDERANAADVAALHPGGGWLVLVDDGELGVWTDRSSSRPLPVV